MNELVVQVSRLEDTRIAVRVEVCAADISEEQVDEECSDSDECYDVSEIRAVLNKELLTMSDGNTAFWDDHDVKINDVPY